MRRLVAVLVVGTALISAACSNADTPQPAADVVAGPPDATTSAAATASASTTPLLTQPDRQRKARAGLISPNGLVAMGGPAAPKTDDDTTNARHLYCNRLISFAGQRAFSYRYWAGEGLLVEQHVEGFMAATATSVLRQVKTAIAECTTAYRVQDRTFQVVGPVDLGTVGGTDEAYGVCLKITDNRRESIWCHGYLALGNFLSYLAVISGPTMATNTNALKQAVLLAAGPLAATATA